MDIADQRRIKQSLGFGPEFIAGFSIPFGIGNQSCYQLQNILLTVNIGERIKMHRFFKIDCVKNLNPIPMLQ